MTIKTSEADVFACLSDVPQSQAEIANKLGIHRSNVTGWLKKLEVKGLAKKTSNGQWVLAGTQQYNATIHNQENRFDDFFRTHHPNIDPYTQFDLAFYVLLDDFATRYNDIIDDNENGTMVDFVLKVLECNTEDLEKNVQSLKQYRLYIERNKHN
jgi:biotin operon repressor